MQKLLSFLLLGFLSLCLNAQDVLFSKQLDSIQNLRKLAANGDFDLKSRINWAEQAVKLSIETEIDSVILKSNRRLSWIYLFDPEYFYLSKEIAKKNIKLSFKLNDSISAAFLNNQLGYWYHSSNSNDSAYYYYYKALKLFETNSDSKAYDNVISQVNAKINIATLQKDEFDFSNSQATTIQAINLTYAHLKNEEYFESLSTLNNLLALNLNGLKEYDKALMYYKKSLEFSANLKNNYIDRLYTKINMAETYRDKKEYGKSLDIYNRLLKDKELPNIDISSYGAVLNNTAYTLYVDNYENKKKIDSLFIEAFKIFNKLNSNYEIACNANDMSEFYTSIGKNKKALTYSKKAYITSKKAREYEEHLRSLKQLSKLENGETGKSYLYEYISLNDSLIASERSNRNKFARIQFETDEYIKETERLNTQNILIISTSGITILILGLLFLIKQQHSKNKQLTLERNQQISNQEIYNLLLNQQTKLEEGRLLERHRISEDMHDGILSDLFAARMGLGFLDVKGDRKTLEKHNKFIGKLQKVESAIRNVSHELKKEDIFTKTNFQSIIEQYLSEKSILANFKYTIIEETASIFEQIQDKNKVALYRILQESIHNIIKHAKASFVNIHFSLDNENLKMIIEDNGKGFETTKKHQGIGLKNIVSRVTKLNGTVKIKSKIKKGSSIHVSLPNVKNDKTT